MKTVTVRWEVEDGYVGKSRPQQFEMTIDPDDFADDMDDLDIEDIIYRRAEDDFESKINFFVNNSAEVIAAIREHLNNA